MANIPVERRAGIPWWVWLLVGLVVLGLLIWIFAGNDERRTAAVEETAPAGATAAGPPVTDLAVLTRAQDQAMLVGRAVQLTNVPVQSLAGERGFYVGPSADERVFVFLGSAVPALADAMVSQGDTTTGATATPDTTGRTALMVGQVVNLDGIMRRADDPALADQQMAGRSAGEDVILHARSVEIVQQPRQRQ